MVYSYFRHPYVRAAASHVAKYAADRVFNSIINSSKRRKMGDMPKGRAVFKSHDTSMHPVYERKRRWGNGKSSGKLRVKRKVRRLRKQKIALVRGVEQTRESCGELNTAKYATYVGHCSQPAQMTAELLWLAIAKKCCEAINGGTVFAVRQPINQLSAGKTVSISYRSNPSAALSAATITVPALTTWSCYDLAYNLRITWEGLTDGDSILIGIASNDVANPFMLNLSNAYVHVYSKSTLKLQNRSYGPDGNEADEVDNVPLYGKSYQCRGNGTQFQGSSFENIYDNGATIPIYVDNFYGVFQKEVSASTDDLAEPPTALAFNGVKRYDKVRIEPGNIKTSALTEKYKITLSRLIGKLQDYAIHNPAKVDLGRFRLFGLEKIIETTVSPTIPIRVAFEHNVRMSIGLTVGKGFTRPMFVPYQA